MEGRDRCYKYVLLYEYSITAGWIAIKSCLYCGKEMKKKARQVVCLISRVGGFIALHMALRECWFYSMTARL